MANEQIKVLVSDASSRNDSAIDIVTNDIKE